jgi:hypothetical protein
MTHLLNRDQILAAEDLQHQDVPVPEWGGTVRIRGLTGDERDAYEITMMKNREAADKGDLTDAHIRAALVAMSIVDEEGKRLFSIADIKALGSKSAAALDRCYNVAQKLARLSAADIEELKGNSGAVPSGASTSA